jgi:hypothetical protein
MGTGYKKPPVEHRIKKGEVRNPLGGKTQNPVLNAMRRLTQEDLADVGQMILAGEFESIKEIAENPKGHNALKAIFCSVFNKAHEKGDMQSLNLFLDRVVGKVKDKVDVTITAKMSDEDLIERARTITKQLEDKGE